MPNHALGLFCAWHQGQVEPGCLSPHTTCRGKVLASGVKCLCLKKKPKGKGGGSGETKLSCVRPLDLGVMGTGQNATQRPGAPGACGRLQEERPQVRAQPLMPVSTYCVPGPLLLRAVSSRGPQPRLTPRALSQVKVKIERSAAEREVDGVRWGQRLL